MNTREAHSSLRSSVQLVYDQKQCQIDRCNKQIRNDTTLI